MICLGLNPGCCRYEQSKLFEDNGCYFSLCDHLIVGVAVYIFCLPDKDLVNVPSPGITKMYFKILLCNISI